ncbi:MAG: hypothetical protein WCJ29_02195 [bacterium]
MAELIVSMWWLVPLAILVATIVATRHHTPAEAAIRQGAFIALAVAVLAGVVVFFTTNADDGSRQILVGAMIGAVPLGILHEECLKSITFWLAVTGIMLLCMPVFREVCTPILVILALAKYVQMKYFTAKKKDH